ncbi:MFS transporter [Mycena indigotica]|uniref:MFS transporter n=1 Tax=Mycena indigotica TaxID=2126181 RepID=A0A8H6SLL1_9AGAR|nr:MFS transporter [Mycena indigotica]KAF7301656.1 MFS transporter [Mycena indigotica]
MQGLWTLFVPCVSVILKSFRIVGLEADTKLHGNQFNTVLSVFYITYILVEIPSNLIMKRMKPAASGLLPGIVLYLSTIYKPHELQYRSVPSGYSTLAHLYPAHSEASCSSLLATAILNMDGKANLAGWRWIFLLEGLATFVSSLICLYFLPSSLASAKFLTEEERDFALRRFHATTSPATQTRDSPDIALEKGDKGSITENINAQSPAEITHFTEEHFELREVIRGLTDFQAWVTAIAYLGLIVSLYSFSLFLPTIVAGLGYKGKSAQLHTVPPYVPATVLTVFVAFLSDRLKWRGPFILICLPSAIVGYILAIAAKTNAQRYGAVFLIAAGVYPSAPSILSILPNNGSGYYKRSTTIALQLAVSNTGGFIATNIYTKDQIPTFYRKGHSIVLGFLVLSWVMTAINILYCMRENKARANGERQGNITAYEELVRTGKTKAPIGDRYIAVLIAVHS